MVTLLVTASRFVFRDVETRVRFLVALPALLIAEFEVPTHNTPFIRQFLDCGIIGEPVGLHDR